MKKLMGVALVALASLSLVGCSGGDSEVTLPGAPLNNKIIEENIKDDELDKKPSVPPISKIVGTNSFRNTALKQDVNTYLQAGIMPVANEYGYVGFYSLFYGREFIKKQYYKDWINYSVRPVHNFGGLLELIYKDVYYLYDSYGNLLVSYKLTTNYNPSVSGLSSRTVNKKFYLSFEFDYPFGDNFIFEYGDSMIPTKVNEIPDQVEEVLPDTEKNEPNLRPGDLYVDFGRLPLDLYGLNNRYLSASQGVYTIFDSSTNQKISSFSIPRSQYRSRISIIGKKMLYQESYPVADDAQSFSYVNRENKKCDLTTTSIDLETGISTKLHLNYLIEQARAIKDENGFYTIGIASISKIVNNHVETGFEYIINSEGALVTDVTGLNFFDIEKLGNSYFNGVTMILYDSSFNEIAHLYSMNPAVDRKNELIFGSINNKHGAIDYNGKVKIAFEYDQIDNTNASNGHVMASKREDGVERFYSINLSNGDDYYVGTNLESLNNGLYKATDRVMQETKFYNAEGKKIYEARAVNNLTTNSSYALGHKFFFIYSESDPTAEDVVTSETVSVCNKEFRDNNKVTGTELTGRVKPGRSSDTATAIKLGNNDVFANNTDYSYCSYTPTTTGYYTFSTKRDTDTTVYRRVPGYKQNDESTAKDYLETIQTVQNGTEMDNENNRIYYHTVLLEANKEYIFKLNIQNSYNRIGFDTLSLKYENGQDFNEIYSNINTPKYYFIGGSEMLIDVYTTEAMTYEIVLTSGAKAYLANNGSTPQKTFVGYKNSITQLRIVVDSGVDDFTLLVRPYNLPNLNEGSTSYKPAQASLASSRSYTIYNNNLYLDKNITQIGSYKFNFSSFGNTIVLVNINGKEWSIKNGDILTISSTTNIKIHVIEERNNTINFGITKM